MSGFPDTITNLPRVQKSGQQPFIRLSADRLAALAPAPESIEEIGAPGNELRA